MSDWSDPMLNDLKTALTRHPLLLAGDLAGAAALVVIFVVGLSLPGLT